MKSMWITLLLIRARSSVADRRRVGVAEREVAGGVLVEQRVEVGDPRFADASLAVDERELAEPRRALVLRAARAQRVGARLGVDLDHAARLEPHAQPAHDGAAHVERLRRRDDAVRALRIGRGEDLLGRQVRDVRTPSTVVEPPPAKREVGSRPIVRSVPGPSKRSASKRCSVRRAPTSCSCAPRSRQPPPASGSSSRSR